MGVIAEMSFLLLGFLLLHLLSNGVSGLDEDVGGNLAEKMYKSEKLNNINEEKKMQRMERMDILESKLESQNVEMGNLQKQLEEIKAEAGDLKKQVKENEIKVENQCQAEVKKELDKVLPTAVELGLRDLPFEMVCAYKQEWDKVGVVNYDRITVEFNNSDLPGGGDGSMNIETGVFTTVTSGYYMITYSAAVDVHPGEYTNMWLYHNGVGVEESQFLTSMYGVEGGDNYVYEQGSRTVILHLLAGDTLDLRTNHIDNTVYALTLCLYMAPA